MYVLLSSDDEHFGNALQLHLSWYMSPLQQGCFLEFQGKLGHCLDSSVTQEASEKIKGMSWRRESHHLHVKRRMRSLKLLFKSYKINEIS